MEVEDEDLEYEAYRRRQSFYTHLHVKQIRYKWFKPKSNFPSRMTAKE